MRSLIEAIVRMLEGGQSLALATIVKQKGSVPRELGAHMVVGQYGDTIGTIGGGVMEATVQRQAIDVIRDGQNRLLELNLNSQTFAADMFCGGCASILIEYIDAREDSYRQFFQAILNHLKQPKPIWLVTWLDAGIPGYPTRHFLINADGKIINEEGEIPSWLDFSVPKIKKVKTFYVLDESGLIVECLNSAETAYIFGGGHTAHKLVPLLDMLGFKTVVIDDRPEYANKQRFPDAHQIHVSPFNTIVPGLEIDEQSYLVIITSGHTHDQEILEQVLRSNAAYIGMIGSKSKRDAIYHSLQEQGFTCNDFERVFCPIGVSIGAEGPAEIAISIAAEMIKTRAERKNSGPKIMTF